MRTIRIGSGAGYSGDRIEPAVELAEHGKLDYLAFECLAERTIALAQLARLRDPSGGYDPLLAERMKRVLRLCAEGGIKLITNMGAANPRDAAARTAEIARGLGLGGLKIAYVTGDDVLAEIGRGDYRLMETGGTAAELGETLISANAYLGAEPIVAALRAGADVVITGRVADPSLFLAPIIHEFGWAFDDWHRLGKGTLIGHLLECAGQITGGYYADPGRKDVPNLARLGFPLAEVDSEGEAVITKVAGSGGRVSTGTCTEQMLYEVHDPATYLTPDVVADFSGVRFTEEAPDRIRIQGATGRERPAQLKVSLGHRAGFIGAGEITYAGPNARARGQLALDIVAERLRLTGVAVDETRFELIGVNSVVAGFQPETEPPEVRVRVAGRTATMDEAIRVGNEVETLFTNGPFGGGGATKSAREIIAVLSTLIDRAAARPEIRTETA